LRGPGRGWRDDARAATYRRHRFPAEIISHAVWLYHVFSLSLRDVELILAERGIVVTHESVRRWCLKFGEAFAAKLRRRRPKPGDTWHLDEVFLRINGVLRYLWRAVDQHGVVLHILVQDPAERRGGKALLQAAARRPGSTSRGASSRTGCAATASPDARSCPVSAPDRPPLEQPRRELPSADPPPGAPNAALQVAGASAAVPVIARHDLRPLPSAPAPDVRHPATGRARVKAFRVWRQETRVQMVA
jgi:putative transposase